MKKIILGLMALMVMSLFNASVYGLPPPNLPHQNSKNFASTIKVFVPYTDLSFGVNTNSAILDTLGVGTAKVQEVNSLGFAGVQMTAAAQDVHMILPIPSNMCVACQLKVSVAWSTSSTTTSQTATWKVLYSAIAAGEALAVAGTALDTAIVADSVTSVAYALQETPQGIIVSNTLSRSDMLHILVELDAVSGLNPASDTVFLHGVYLEYTREKI